MNPWEIALAAHRQGDLAQAIALYEQILVNGPEQGAVWANLALAYQAVGNVPGAQTCYERALSLKPEQPAILTNLGTLFQEQGDFLSAQIQYERALALDPSYSQAHYNLGLLYKAQQRMDLAIVRYQQAVNLAPDYLDAWFNLGVVLREDGQDQAALTAFDRVLELDPHHGEALWHRALFLPILYDNPEQIAPARAQFSEGLDRLINQIDPSSPQALAGIGALTNFYLQYQGCNDLALQSQYGDFVHEIMSVHYPQYSSPLTLPIHSNSKIRVGYIFEFPAGHAGVWWASGWLKHGDSDQFEIYGYCTGPYLDAKTEFFRSHSIFHHLPGDIGSIATQIRSDQLHILVYTDVGMAPRLTQLAALRLAPIQCVGWGHPVTTGLPTMDYFLSGERQEADGSQSHYRETLIALAGLGVCFPWPQIPRLSVDRASLRRTFGLREQAIVYLCCQSLFKYLPQYDHVWPAIAQQVPTAQFAFFRAPSSRITEQFWGRLQRAFKAVGLRAEDYCVFIPRQNRADYWLSDIFLDSIGWSAGNTALEALACGLPVITWPGAFMRGRHSYGMLAQLEVLDTVVDSASAYIDCAVHLGLDPARRRAISQRIQSRLPRLFDDLKNVESLETFYQWAVLSHGS